MIFSDMDTQDIYLLFRFEQGLYKTKGKIGLAQCPEMTYMADTFSLTTTTNWFDIFLATLDCYCWVFSQGLLKPDKLLVGGELSIAPGQKVIQFLTICIISCHNKNTLRIYVIELQLTRKEPVCSEQSIILLRN